MTGTCREESSPPRAHQTTSRNESNDLKKSNKTGKYHSRRSRSKAHTRDGEHTNQQRKKKREETIQQCHNTKHAKEHQTSSRFIAHGSHKSCPPSFVSSVGWSWSFANAYAHAFIVLTFVFLFFFCSFLIQQGHTRSESGIGKPNPGKSVPRMFLQGDRRTFVSCYGTVYLAFGGVPFQAFRHFTCRILNINALSGTYFSYF